MRNASHNISGGGHADPIPPPIHVACPSLLHRLGEVRRQKNIARGAVARHLGVTVAQVIEQECGTADLPLSVLYKWAEALGVPVTELLVQANDPLSATSLDRTRIVQIFGTAMGIMRWAGNLQTKRWAETLIDQLIEIMPQLRDVEAEGAAVEPHPNATGVKAGIRRLPACLFYDPEELP
jgi:transcriptional regulator with XRE-family HTH domain